MLLYKGGITLEIDHPVEIARLKRFGYVEVRAEEATQPASEPALDFAQEQQKIAEEIIQPHKAKKDGKK